MEKVIKRAALAAAAATAVLAGCSELADIRVRDMDNIHVVVESFLTDKADERQSVTLSGSVDYFSSDGIPAIRGAKVSVDDGAGVSVTYTESEEEPGVYYAPEGFCGKPGGRYHLKVETIVAGRERTYEAFSTMPEKGFELDSIDYAFSGNKMFGIDSLWTVYTWGRDLPQTSYYYISAKVNGHKFPFQLSLPMDDKYFAGQEVEDFPITVLNQTARNQKRYGECCKYLETGDVITIFAYTLPKECYDFLLAFSSSSSGINIPLFSSQPANCPTNIEGEDAMGFFAACPVTESSCTVDDPMKMPRIKWQ